MKPTFLKILFALSLAASTLPIADAQDSEDAGPKPPKKLIFQPGAKVPDLSAASTPTPVPVSRAMAMDPTVAKIISDFFDRLQRNKVDEAYDQLTTGTAIAEKTEDVANLKAKTAEAIRLFGDIEGRELVSMKVVGQHLFSATYLSLGSEMPLRWKFYFYRLDASWKLIDIGVDDRLVDIFEDKDPSPGPAPKAP
jgi:hypothetical protein